MAHLQAAYVAGIIFTPIFGLVSTKIRSIREPMAVGFLIWTGGLIGFATLQPGQSANSIAFLALVGLALSALLSLIITGVQLAVPHSHLAAASAIVSVSRAVSGSIFTAIYFATFDNRTRVKLPAYIAQAAAKAGLSLKSIPLFVEALAGGNSNALAKVPGVTPQIIAAGVAALKQAYADSIRAVYYIAVSFAVVAVILCFFVGSLSKTMTYHVDAPDEELHAKVKHNHPEEHL